MRSKPFHPKPALACLPILLGMLPLPAQSGPGSAAAKSQALPAEADLDLKFTSTRWDDEISSDLESREHPSFQMSVTAETKPEALKALEAEIARRFKPGPFEVITKGFRDYLVHHYASSFHDASVILRVKDPEEARKLFGEITFIGSRNEGRLTGQVINLLIEFRTRPGQISYRGGQARFPLWVSVHPVAVHRYDTGSKVRIAEVGPRHINTLSAQKRLLGVFIRELTVPAAAACRAYVDQLAAAAGELEGPHKAREIAPEAGQAGGQAGTGATRAASSSQAASLAEELRRLAAGLDQGDASGLEQALEHLRAFAQETRRLREAMEKGRTGMQAEAVPGKDTILERMEKDIRIHGELATRTESLIQRLKEVGGQI